MKHELSFHHQELPKLSTNIYGFLQQSYTQFLTKLPHSFFLLYVLVRSKRILLHLTQRNNFNLICYWNSKMISCQLRKDCKASGS
jgi:hypothetical protein